MFRDKTLEFLFQPALISFFLWIVIFLVLPFQSEKYRIKILSEESIPQGLYLYYNDLDNDGISELISADIHDSEQTKIIVRKNNRVIDQFNLPYNLANNNAIIFKDCNNDGFKEIIVFTLSDNSIFINLIDPISTRSLLIYNRLIDRWEKPAHSNDRPYFDNIFTADGLDGVYRILCVNAYNQILHLSSNLIKNCCKIIPQSRMGIVHFFSILVIAR